MMAFTGDVTWLTWDHPKTKFPPQIPADGYYLDWKTTRWTAIGPPNEKALEKLIDLASEQEKHTAR